MVAGPVKVVEPEKLGGLGLGAETGTHQQMRGLETTTFVGTDPPATIVAEMTGLYPGIQRDVAAEVEDPLDMLKIAHLLVMLASIRLLYNPRWRKCDVKAQASKRPIELTDLQCSRRVDRASLLDGSG